MYINTQEKGKMQMQEKKKEAERKTSERDTDLLMAGPWEMCERMDVWSLKRGWKFGKEGYSLLCDSLGNKVFGQSLSMKGIASKKKLSYIPLTESPQSFASGLS